MLLTKSKVYFWVTVILTVLLPAFHIVKGNSSLFYILYIFWWHELLTTSVDFIQYLFQKKFKDFLQVKLFLSRYFLLMIYFVFIVVAFGFIPSFGNKAMMSINFKVFLFQDALFNASIISILINECWYRYYHQEDNSKVYESPFSGRMIAMHLSIILGGVLFSSYKYLAREDFASEYQWQSLLAAMPFLILKIYIMYKEEKESLENKL